MKRIFCLLVMVMICCISFAYAADIDLSQMSDAELKELITHAQEELNSRTQGKDATPVLYDDNGIKLYLTGKHDIQHRTDAELVYFEYIVENNTSSDLEISGRDGYVNGWDIGYVSFYGEPNAGKKAKDVFCVDIKPASISEYKAIEEIEFTIELYLGKSKYSLSDPSYKKKITMILKDGTVEVKQYMI